MPEPIELRPATVGPKPQTANAEQKRPSTNGTREFMAACRGVWRGHRGSSTPFEDLIVNLMVLYEVGWRLPEPDLVDKHSSNYRQEYEDALALARQLLMESPDLFSHKPIPIQAA